MCNIHPDLIVKSFFFQQSIWAILTKKTIPHIFIGLSEIICENTVPTINILVGCLSVFNCSFNGNLLLYFLQYVFLSVYVLSL